MSKPNTPEGGFSEYPHFEGQSLRPEFWADFEALARGC